jgi:hypothetical protein
MKTTYFLKLEIELAELKLKLANHRLDKHHAMEKDPAEDLNRHINPANLAFQEHFSHIFTQLTALHEKLMEEERFIEAKNVMDQCMSVAVYIQTWGEERW